MRRIGRQGNVRLGALLVIGLTTGWVTMHVRAAEPPSKQAVDPEAIASLERMGTFLRNRIAMEVTSEVTTDDLLPSGQKVQYSGMVKVRIHRPDRMYAEVLSDRKNERMFYDGTTFTVFQPKLGYYASFAAPPDLNGLVDVLEDKYGIDLPLADLFRWGTDAAPTSAILRATMVGRGLIRGAPCVHYAFHQSDIDWEVWIEEGPQPLPRKLVITTITEKTQPQHSSVMTWNLTPRPDEMVFTFTPPPNAHRIAFDTTGGMPDRPTRQGHTPASKRGAQ